MIAQEGAIFKHLGTIPEYKAIKPSFLKISYMNLNIDNFFLDFEFIDDTEEEDDDDDNGVGVDDELECKSFKLLVTCNRVFPTSNGFVANAAAKPDKEPLMNEFKNTFKLEELNGS
ncbi:unnamed protein product [[Candida] boidinii]|uniref:Unnamed protein product n=1 Tax=Candida boidinii TaxID=5477 RepID=A0A9W6T225_CANBO|nr:unnamed protein product [[Candida] boidinii]GMG23461.1 unnamed protein product [[Candida] boidinii]